MDHAAVIDLARRCLLAADAAEAEQIVSILTRDGAAGDAVTREAGGKLIGAALFSAGRADQSAMHLDLLLVDPAERRRGVATEMIEAGLQTARERGFTSMKVMGNPPNYAWPGVDVRYTEAICTLTAAHFIHSRTAWNMTAPLPAPPEGPAPAGIEIRLAVPADLERLLPAVHEQWGPAWTVEVERAVLGDGGVHLALRDGEAVAFAAWGGCRPSWFGPMGTLPGATGLGLGGILLRRCLNDQAALGLESAQIGWVGPIGFYANAAGARIERVFFLFDKQL